MHITRMGTKTISLEREAYERLRAARRYPEESFSEVVLRASWAGDTLTARELLDRYREKGTHIPERLLDRVETLKRTDRPPEDKWSKRSFSRPRFSSISNVSSVGAAPVEPRRF